MRLGDQSKRRWLVALFALMWLFVAVVATDTHSHGHVRNGADACMLCHFSGTVFTASPAGVSFQPPHLVSIAGVVFQAVEPRLGVCFSNQGRAPPLA